MTTSRVAGRGCHGDIVTSGPRPALCAAPRVQLAKSIFPIIICIKLYFTVFTK